jgi:hypothetical protein
MSLMKSPERVGRRHAMRALKRLAVAAGTLFALALAGGAHIRF